MLREASPKAKLLQSSFHFEIILLRNLNFHGWRTVSRFSKQLVRPAHSNRGKPLHFALKKDKGSRLAYTTTLWIEYYSLFGQFNIYPATSGCTIENLGIKYPLDLGKELFIRFICPRNFPLRCLARPVKISFNMSSDRRSFSHFRNLCKNFIPFRIGKTCLSLHLLAVVSSFFVFLVSHRRWKRRCVLDQNRIERGISLFLVTFSVMEYKVRWNFIYNFIIERC